MEEENTVNGCDFCQDERDRGRSFCGLCGVDLDQWEERNKQIAEARAAKFEQMVEADPVLKAAVGSRIALAKEALQRAKAIEQKYGIKPGEGGENIKISGVTLTTHTNGNGFKLPPQPPPVTFSGGCSLCGITEECTCEPLSSQAMVERLRAHPPVRGMLIDSAQLGLPELRYQLLDPNCTPRYATDGAAGLDLCCAEQTSLMPWRMTSAIARVPLGIALEIPEGWVGVMQGRSSLGYEGLWVFQGIIDSDYRGPISCLCVNLSDHTIRFEVGQRIAQLVVHQAPQLGLVQVEQVAPTARGAGGFGSTGK